MAAAQKSGGAMPPSPPPPPPVPVSGITPARKAIAPSLTEEPKGQRPEQAFADRQKAAIAKATGEGQKQQDAAAGEDAAPPPKAAATPKAAAAPTSKPSETSSKPASDTSKASTPATASEKPADTATPAEAPKAVYDFASLKKWSEENPEDAAKLFKIPEDTRSEWIRLKNRERRVKENIRTAGEEELTKARAERQAAEEARQAIDSAAGKLGPIADLWEAVAEKVAADPSNPQVDFEAADAAFLENAKISIDDYMRLRARRSIGSSSDAVRLRVENQKLKRQLEGKPSDALKTTQKETSAAVETSAAAEASVPAKGKAARDWSGELDGKHKLKQLDGWNDMLDVEMRKYRDSDTDEYDADPNEIADKLLKREIARMMEDDAPAEPPPRSRTQAAKPPLARPVVKPKAKDDIPSPESLRPKLTTPDEERDEVQLRGGKKLTWSQIQNRAIQRAQARARGEID